MSEFAKRIGFAAVAIPLVVWAVWAGGAALADAIFPAYAKAGGAVPGRPGVSDSLIGMPMPR